ncbi:DUF2521 family protein [Bacillus lacus]|uniref:DUF2521 family protein n=1 Tax=Metabacillus lacus TaxID=1983721 RepID=A0A7X2LXF2_9BACI|nr:DUF2521 family protein [Metabacillus lacus]MRX72500.1 DUF2521 family protein [Metabacillus lacus]
MDKPFLLKDKRREKQLKYEKTMLKELSLKEIQGSIEHCFGEMTHCGSIQLSRIEEGCVDFAIESFLLGASYSRFGFFGETMETASLRCRREEKYLVDDLYEYLLYWGKAKEYPFIDESIFIACEFFITSWWKEGFFRGEKRYKLRLN